MQCQRMKQSRTKVFSRNNKQQYMDWQRIYVLCISKSKQKYKSKIRCFVNGFLKKIVLYSTYS